MKTENDVLQIIASQLQEVIDESDYGNDFHWVICTERIFVDDYKPKVDDYLSDLNVTMERDRSYDIDSLPDGYEHPSQMPYQHTIFVILNMGQGQMNFAVWNCPVTMKIVSEENAFDETRNIVTEFMAKVNFKYLDEIIQSYFTPEVSGALSEMYAGFRGLMMCKGYVRVPQPGIVFVTKIMIENEDGDWFDFPFINIGYTYNAQPDMQAFPGYNGSARSLNRMTTQAISVGCYLWTNSDNEDIDAFSKDVLNAQNQMNKKFKLAVISNIEDDEYAEFGGFMPISVDYYILKDCNYSQEWGDLSTWALMFVVAKEKEDGEV